MKSVLKVLPVAALALGLVFGGLVFGTVPAAAQQPAPPKPSPAAMALAKEIMDLKKINAIWSEYVPEIVGVVRNGLISQHMPLQKDVNEVAPAVAQQLAARGQEVRDGIAEIYASAFTEQELKDLVVFYKSPLGQKLITTEPNVVRASIDFRNAWGQKFTDTVVSGFRAELKKRGKDL